MSEGRGFGPALTLSAESTVYQWLGVSGATFTPFFGASR